MLGPGLGEGPIGRDGDLNHTILDSNVDSPVVPLIGGSVFSPDLDPENLDIAGSEQLADEGTGWG